MDIMRNLPADIGALVLGKMQEEDLERIKSKPGIPKATAAARKACCAKTEQGA